MIQMSKERFQEIQAWFETWPRNVHEQEHAHVSE